jgi:hypothetical protein
MDNKWKFELVVHGVSEETADRILDLITEVVGLSGGAISGGFVQDEEESDGEENAV